MEIKNSNLPWRYQPLLTLAGGSQGWGAPTNHDLLIQACADTDSFIYRDKDGN